MTYLPQLRDQLASNDSRTPRRLGARTSVIFAVIALVIAASALAATGVIPIGSPVAPPARFQGAPDRGPGTPVETTARILSLRVPDPGGGPPWGLRRVETTRGLTGIQVGRVVRGRLGVLGQDGIAGNDGRFHPLSLRYATLPPAACATADGAGDAYLAVEFNGLASGEGPPHSCLGPGEGSSEPRPRCPVADHRRFLFGLVGPEAVEVSYRNKGRIRRAALARPAGAYLVVLAQRLRGGLFMSSRTPRMGHPFQRIQYQDGTACPPLGTRPSLRVSCLPGRYRSALAGLDRDAMRRPLDSQVLPPPQRGRPLQRLRVSFNAPVAINDARFTYQLQARFLQTCRGLYLVPSTNRDVRRGARVELTVGVPKRCHGPLAGTVGLTAPTTGMDAPLLGDSESAIRIGRFRETVP
jgi:hypothetical protein